MDPDRTEPRLGPEGASHGDTTALGDSEGPCQMRNAAWGRRPIIPAMIRSAR
jgi:hypothetical protein